MNRILCIKYQQQTLRILYRAQPCIFTWMRRPDTDGRTNENGEGRISFPQIGRRKLKEDREVLKAGLLETK